ncbi:MAG: hypothetical protein HY788_12625 [Deltaproteobacteria bacterium]|nr:hypothetical protein [Deltaproteobacteria bacterium]
MKRIGILIDSLNCDKYLHDTVKELAQNGRVNLFFLLTIDGKPKQHWLKELISKLHTSGLLRFIELAFFDKLTQFEYRILSNSSSQLKAHSKLYNLSDYINNNLIHVKRTYSKSALFVRFSDDAINKIKALNLDLIIKGNARGIFQGAILRSAKQGIISFHHGDNRWNRGGPAAFWEVYLHKPSTGFIIQILTEELDGGSVIFRGEIPTRRTYTENLVNLYNESYPYLSKVILAYANSGYLPVAEDKVPYPELILKAPSIFQSIKYLLLTGLLLFRLGLNKKVFHKHERWSVAFIASKWQDAILRDGVQINNPSNRFFADPFVVTREGKTICYVEDFCYSRNKGCITAIELIDNKTYNILGPVIQEPFHMSFPYLFEYDNHLYMIPETHETNSIRLYKCVNFPLHWEYQKTLMNNVNTSDSMLFAHKERWWLFTNVAIKNSNDYDSQLFAYYTDHPLSEEWTPHKNNPLIFNSNIARNGGILDAGSDSPVRVRQKQGFASYGSGLTLAKIVDLSLSTYSEVEICEIVPHFYPRIKGCHHLFSNGRYTVFDYLRLEKSA